MQHKNQFSSFISFLKKNEDYILVIPVTLVFSAIITLISGSFLVGISVFGAMIYRIVPRHNFLILSIATVIALIIIAILMLVMYIHATEDFRTTSIILCLAAAMLIGVYLIMLLFKLNSSKNEHNAIEDKAKSK